MKNHCNEKGFAPFPTIKCNTATTKEALFTFDWVGENITQSSAWPKKSTKTPFDGRWTSTPPQYHRQTSASERIPAIHNPGTALLSIGSVHLRGKRNITLENLIHTNSQFTVVVVSKCICSFYAERRVHLLLILDRLTSASLFSPSRALSARVVDAPDRCEIASTAFWFLQQVDVEAASGELFKPPWWESRSPSWPTSVSK